MQVYAANWKARSANDAEGLVKAIAMVSTRAGIALMLGLVGSKCTVF